jgi:hypothetical protein
MRPVAYIELEHVTFAVTDAISWEAPDTIIRRAAFRAAPWPPSSPGAGRLARLFAADAIVQDPSVRRG